MTARKRAYGAVLFLALLLTAASQAVAANMVVAETPKVLPPIAFAGADGQLTGLDAFRGKVVVLDYWATWCAPCRAEFPVLDRLQERLGARGLAVVAVSVDRAGLRVVDKFYAEAQVTHLDKYVDPDSTGAQGLKLRGVPTSLVVDRQGREVARVEGLADWEGKGVTSLLDKLLAAGD